MLYLLLSVLFPSLRLPSNHRFYRQVFFFSRRNQKLFPIALRRKERFFLVYNLCDEEWKLFVFVLIYETVCFSLNFLLLRDQL